MITDMRPCRDFRWARLTIRRFMRCFVLFLSIASRVSTAKVCESVMHLIYLNPSDPWFVTIGLFEHGDGAPRAVPSVGRPVGR